MGGRWKPDETIETEETTTAIDDNRLESMLDFDVLLMELKKVNENLLSIIEALGG